MTTPKRPVEYVITDEWLEAAIRRVLAHGMQYGQLRASHAIAAELERHGVASTNRAEIEQQLADMRAPLDLKLPSVRKRKP